MKIEDKYIPSNFESDIYSDWVNGGYFTPKVDKKKEPFTIVMPPPNITGQLHMGHALNNSIQDVIIRFKRMQGFSALWLPGTDHASIATEVKIVDKLEKEGLSKQELGREEFLRRAWEWKEQYGGLIVEQMKRLGLSCDWSREAFTMDERCSKAVIKVFIDLYNKNLIYRGNRIINWCPSCKTALSDAEVEYEEQESNLWHVKYPLKDGSGFITIATTRPETILGDTAVAVNPKDERYVDLIGKTLILPLVNKEIQIIADDYVEIEFGSGAVKITPAHDPNDFEVGLRHNLEQVVIMDDSAIMNANAGVYQGLSSKEARVKIVEDLEKGGYLTKIEKYNHNVGVCYRCSTNVEPMISQQWFVKMEPLAKPAINVVKKRKVEFIPERFSKTYYNWMENIRDWCISRQLWWGHRIPAYYCNSCGEIVVSDEMPKKCNKCNCHVFKQDEDVLDTWFSSALWPFSTLGYPDKTKDLAYFFPTNVLVTAYDIIFFWVARMIFSSVEHMDNIPFTEVLIHGIVRDKLGRKMSKSLGNGIDPLPLIDKYGADSVRFALLSGIAPGNDTRFYEEKVENTSTFMNKIWNVAKFVMINSKNITPKEIGSYRLSVVEKWILSRLNDTVNEVTNNLNKYELGLACGKLYNFVWNDFCDWYIELIKIDLKSEDSYQREKAFSTLKYVFETILKLLHPFIPFITEEIYRTLNKNGRIINSDWPRYQKKYTYRDVSAKFEEMIAIIKSIRNMKSELNIPLSREVEILLFNQDEDIRKFLNLNEKYLRAGGLKNFKFIEDKKNLPKEYKSVMSNLNEIFVRTENLINIEEEIDKIEKKIQFINSEITRSTKLLANKGFVEKAPKTLVEKEEEKIKTNTVIYETLKKQLDVLRNKSK